VQLAAGTAPLMNPVLGHFDGHRGQIEDLPRFGGDLVGEHCAAGIASFGQRMIHHMIG